MFREPKSKSLNWQPSYDIDTLKERAKFLQAIRNFFAQRDVLEVDTPVLAQSASLDLHVTSLKLEEHPRYLQSSPECFMKRLVAAGSGAIYQLGKVFRQGEQGHKHNPEFTLLEWYRPGWALNDLIQEVDVLLQHLLGTKPCQVITYQALFEEFCHINPHTATFERTREVLNDVHGISDLSLSKDDCLNLILTHMIEPHIAKDVPLVVTEFPATQCALAKILPGEPPKAARFEIFYQGFEIANGYDELNNANEQRARLNEDNQKRHEQGQATYPIDERFLAAVDALPQCSGVAMGVDRLLQIATNKPNIAQVLPFAWENA